MVTGRRGIERVRFEAKQQRCLPAPRCAGRRRDVEGDTRQRALRLDTSGDARYADVADDHEPRRLAQFERADDGASARLTKSSGTNHARPSRTGAAGNEMSRPATDTSSWLGERMIDWLRTVIVSPPAIVSSRSARPRGVRARRPRTSPGRSSRTASGRRPSRDSTV